MTHVEICPVCNGTGKKQQFGMTTTSSSPIYENCHGCQGSGWVTVYDNTIYPLSDSSYPYEGDSRKDS